MSSLKLLSFSAPASSDLDDFLFYVIAVDDLTGATLILGTDYGTFPSESKAIQHIKDALDERMIMREHRIDKALQNPSL